MEFFFFRCCSFVLFCYFCLFIWLFLPASYFYQKMCDFAIKAQATVGDLWIQKQWENAPVLLNKVSLPEFKLNISLWQWAHRKGSAGRNGLWFPSVTPGLLASTTSISSVHRLHFTPLCHLCKLLPLPLPFFFGANTFTSGSSISSSQFGDFLWSSEMTTIYTDKWSLFPASKNFFLEIFKVRGK